MKAMRFLLCIWLMLLASVSLKTYSGDLLNPCYIMVNHRYIQSDSTKVCFVKYYFYDEGKGQELRVEIKKEADTLLLCKEEYPLTWTIDLGQRLTVETQLNTNYTIFRQYDILYGGTYLEQVRPLKSILYPISIDFVYCTDKFMEPDGINNIEMLSGIYYDLSHDYKTEKYSDEYILWPWKSKDEANWNAGNFRIERKIETGNSLRIIVSKNGIFYTLISPPNRPYSPASKLYNSWESLKNMKIGDSVDLVLEVYMPFSHVFDGSRGASYNSKTYESCALNGLVASDKILVCGNHASGLYYGIIN